LDHRPQLKIEDLVFNSHAKREWKRLPQFHTIYDSTKARWKWMPVFIIISWISVRLLTVFLKDQINR